jgi:asparagine synthase (glutamine-hydrolysing)
MEAMQYLVPYRFQGALRSIVGKELLPAWMNKAWFSGADSLNRPIVGGRSHSLLRDMLDQAISSTTLPHLLRYQDRASMCYSVESRVPFLTGAFIQSSRLLPEDYLIGESGMGKHIFIKAMRGLVPDALLDRRDKAGFDMAKYVWVRDLSGFIDSIFTSERARACAPINHSSLMKMWSEVREGNRHPDVFVWRSMNLIAWAERFDMDFSQGNS